MQVHLKEKNMNMSSGEDGERIFSLKEVMVTMGQFIIPIVVLIWILISGFTPTLAAIVATVLTIADSYIKQETRLNHTKIVDELNRAISMFCHLIAVCDAAGLVVGSINITALAGVVMV